MSPGRPPADPTQPVARWWALRIPTCLLLALVLLTGCTEPDRVERPTDTTAGSPAPTTAPESVEPAPDPLVERTLQELHTFVAWLRDHDVDGFIGEVGWPAGPGYDTERWNGLARRWFEVAREADLWVAVWGAGAWWGTDYPLSPYVASDGEVIDEVAPQAVVIEAQRGEPPVGVNVSGAEFGAPPGSAGRSSFSNEAGGEVGRDYRYPDGSSLRFLSERGVEFIRLAFRWERIQPQLGGPLDRTELRLLRRAIRAADHAGLGVVLDVHNYGGYFRADGSGGGVRHPVGHPDVPIAAYLDLWRRLSEDFHDDEAVLAYGLMNEPHSLGDGDGDAASARLWEAVSQAAVDAVRATGDDKLIMVPGANWSNVRGWVETHPEPWIDDPADRVRYEAHHYFDSDQSGAYPADYDHELQIAGRHLGEDE